MRILGCMIVAGIVAAAGPAAAQEKRWTQAGTLACDLGPSVGLIVGSSQRAKCLFKASTGGKTQAYTGTINRLGLDVGVTAGGKMVWGVFGTTNTLSPGALAGTYVGASGDIAVGAGVGANALIGGSRNSVSLQPLSVEGQVGVNLALGIASLKLQ